MTLPDFGHFSPLRMCPARSPAPPKGRLPWPCPTPPSKTVPTLRPEGFASRPQENSPNQTGVGRGRDGSAGPRPGVGRLQAPSSQRAQGPSAYSSSALFGAHTRAPGSGHCGGKGRTPQAPPLAPLLGCKQTHAFAVANGTERSGGGRVLQTAPGRSPRWTRGARPPRPAPGREERAPRPAREPRAPRPPCPLAALQMELALGPARTPRLPRPPGPNCPQTPVQRSRSRDKYTRIPGVPTGPLCLSGARRGSAPGAAPGPS